MNAYRTFLSIFNLAPNNDPDKDAAELIKEAASRVEDKISELHKPLKCFLETDDLYTSKLGIDLDYYKGGLQGDMNRIAGDFKTAASKMMRE